MSPLKRLLRRIPLLRWCILQYALRIRQEQSEASWAYVQSVLTTIGNITICWAGIELVLSHLVLWHIKKVGALPKRGIPRMLNNQLDYVKSTIEKDASLDDATRAKLTELRQRITALNEFRISIIHGVLHQRNRHTMEWHTRSIKIGETGWKLINSTYSNEDIQRRSLEIAALGHEMSPFVASVIGVSHLANSA